jgi:hypothetical protein
MAFARHAFKLHVGEHRATTGLGLLEVDHHRGPALTTARKP